MLWGSQLRASKFKTKFTILVLKLTAPFHYVSFQTEWYWHLSIQPLLTQKFFRPTLAFFSFAISGGLLNIMPKKKKKKKKKKELH